MRPLAVLISDIHLSLKKPRCRASEPDWMMDVQRRQLKEVRELASQYGIPVLCAGDIFDQWNAPAELINFALDELPDNMYCIYGNHDAAWHSQNQLHKSAYQTLVRAGKIIDLPPGKSFSVSEDLEVCGYPWGVPITPAPHSGRKLRVAVMHAYVWADGTGHAKADEKSHCRNFSKVFKTYDVVHLGDNHTPFHHENAYNPGSFFRRTVLDKVPRVGLLMSDGTVKTHKLKSAEKDIIDDMKLAVEMAGGDFSEYLDFLRENSDTQFDFRNEVQRYVDKEDVDKYTAQMIFDAMERR